MKNVVIHVYILSEVYFFSALSLDKMSFPGECVPFIIHAFTDTVRCFHNFNIFKQFFSEIDSCKKPHFVIAPEFELSLFWLVSHLL